MAAAYLFHICQNHAFTDGNKRVGANAAITFLLMNDWEPNFEPDDLADLVLSVASGVEDKAAGVAFLWKLIAEGRIRGAIPKVHSMRHLHPPVGEFN